MSAKKLATVTNELIESYGNTAKNVINAYRVGNERAVVFMDHTWATAVNKAGTRLSAEVRGNAVAAEKKFSSLYARGVELTSDGADVAVNKAVELAGKSVVQVAANASRFEKVTGVNLSPLAIVAVPAAQVVSKVAAQMEARSGALANRIGGKKAKVKVAAVKRAAPKKNAPAPKAVAPKATKAPKSVKIAPEASAPVDSAV
ncbi:MAG: hypothetical protein K9K38_15295 [Rhodoferax sp.]|nr:hypothetical protein [Rhodoferax sp.]MCF8210746.1 hypothetical protein [Rhodoferax sp.]